MPATSGSSMRHLVAADVDRPAARFRAGGCRRLGLRDVEFPLELLDVDFRSDGRARLPLADAVFEPVAERGVVRPAEAPGDGEGARRRPGAKHVSSIHVRTSRE